MEKIIQTKSCYRLYVFSSHSLLNLLFAFVVLLLYSINKLTIKVVVHVMILLEILVLTLHSISCIINFKMLSKLHCNVEQLNVYRLK